MNTMLFIDKALSLVDCIGKNDGTVSREQIDIELWKGIDSVKAGRIYTVDEVDAIFAKEFGI